MDKETYYGVSEYADTSTASLGDITFDVTEGSLSPFTLDTNSSFISGGTSVNTITLDNITYDSSSWDGLAVTIDAYNTTTIDSVNWSDDNNAVFSIDGITLNSSYVEFEDTMPEVAKVEDMCKDYPALAKAYENFKTFYKLVEQDWIGRQKEDDPPF
jgi:hypothetical protein